MLRRWIARLQELDALATEADRAGQMARHTAIGQGGEVYRQRYAQKLDEFNARRFWWMRAKRPNWSIQRPAPGRTE